ncbi:SPOR domain-containing protein [Gordonia sp. NPDC003376]
MTRRPQWVLPVIIGSVIGLIVIVAVIFGVRWSRSTWGDSMATATTSPTTITSVMTQTTTVSRTPTTELQTPEPQTPEREPTDRTTRAAPVPPVASAQWYAQFGAFDDYDNAVAVRDEHYGSLIMPGEMLGSVAGYVVARPAASRAVAQQVCDRFSSGQCVVKERS